MGKSDTLVAVMVGVMVGGIVLLIIVSILSAHHKRPFGLFLQRHTKKIGVLSFGLMFLAFVWSFMHGFSVILSAVALVAAVIACICSYTSLINNVPGPESRSN